MPFCATAKAGCGLGRGLVSLRISPGRRRRASAFAKSVAGRTFAEPQAVSCPESTPEIQFHFQGLSFRSGAEQMRYSHRLVGYGPAEEWSAFAPANRVTYQDVPAGLFHFEVRTVDRDGLMSDVARLQVRVVPTHLRRLEQMLRVSNRGFLSQSQAMARLLDQVESMAETDMTVLVLGETGVGKGVLARLLHNLSPRQANPFIPVNWRRPVRRADRKRTVRPRERGLYQRKRAKDRLLRAGRWRHLVPRRGGRFAVRLPTGLAPHLGGGPPDARWWRAVHPGRCADRRRDQQESGKRPFM